MKAFWTLLCIIFTILTSCNDSIPSQNLNSVEEATKTWNWKDAWEKPEEKKVLLNNKALNYRIHQSLEDTNIVVLTGSLLRNLDRYSEVKAIGDLDHDGVPDSIIVIPELFISKDSSYESGTSVLFMNQKIPRIRVDVPCLAVDFIFAAEDINEDGIVELGKYYTSCVSRFKRLDLLSLVDGTWEPMGAVTFDILYKEPPREERIKKTGNGIFEMREITENAGIRVDEWIEFEFR